MKKIHFFIIFFFIFCFSSNAEDEILLNDECLLKGDILDEGEGTITIKTRNLGVLTISKSVVKSISNTIAKNEQVRNDFLGESELLKKETHSPRNIVRITNNENGEEKELSDEQVIADEAKKPWLYKIDFTGHSTAGNKNTNYMGLRFHLKKEVDEVKINTSVFFEREKVNEDLVKQSVRFMFDYEHTELPHSWYTKTDISHDRIRGYNILSSQSLGYGHYFYKEDNKELRLRNGIYAMYEDYINDENESTLGWDLGLFAMYKFTNNWKIAEEFNYKLPTETDFYFWTSNSWLEIPLFNQKATLKLGIKYDYANMVPDKIENLDSRYYVLLSIGWLEFLEGYGNFF